MTPEILARIHAACFIIPRPWSAEEFDTLMTLKGVRLFPHENGFALTRQIADEAELLTIAVVPTAQGRNIGTTLLNKAHEMLRHDKVAEIFLEVSEYNAPARALYNKLGYEETARRRDYYGPDHDALLLVTSL